MALTPAACSGREGERSGFRRLVEGQGEGGCRPPLASHDVRGPVPLDRGHGQRVVARLCARRGRARQLPGAGSRRSSRARRPSAPRAARPPARPRARCRRRRRRSAPRRPRRKRAIPVLRVIVGGGQHLVLAGVPRLERRAGSLPFPYALGGRREVARDGARDAPGRSGDACTPGRARTGRAPPCSRPSR